MERTVECDQFLKYFAKVADQNPDVVITKDSIYHSLTRYNIDPKYLNINIESLYSRWIEHFKNNSNIKVFVQDNWKYFCQFKNNPYKPVKLNNPIKMYIPINPENIEVCALEMFEFLARENIYHTSKIGKNVRNDNIVLRVYTVDDARKISNFVNSKPYIKKNVMKTNPFVFNSASIGYAIDGNLSYNLVTSELISNYINMRKKSNSLNLVSIIDFKIYLNLQYQRLFVNRQGTYEFLGNFKNKPDCPIDKLINNYREVTKLLITSLETNNMSNYYNCLYEFNNEQISKEEIDKFKNTNEEYTNQEKLLFDEFILTTIKKYGLKNGRQLISEYVNTNRITAVTRTNDLRNRVGQSLTSGKCKAMLKDLDLDGYISNLVYVDTKSIESIALINAINTTYKKYGYEQVVTAIEKSLQGVFNYFTNDSNARTNLVATVSKEKIEEIIKNEIKCDIIDTDIIYEYLSTILYDVEKRNNNERR